VTDFNHTIAQELKISRQSVAAALRLFGEGATVPFVARYRKEATGGLDEVQLIAVKDRASYLGELASRREAVLKSIEQQGKLSVSLRQAIERATTKTELEDLYLPYRPKRQSRATKARDAGLEPLADAIWAQQKRLESSPSVLARRYLNPEAGITDEQLAWQGARDIVAERISDDAPVRRALREALIQHGTLGSKRIKKRKGAPDPSLAEKFRDYFDFAESVRRLRSHRVLALRRGEKEGVLRVSVGSDQDRNLALLRRMVVRERHAVLAGQLDQALTDAYERLLAPAIAKDVRKMLHEQADEGALQVFGENLRNLLFAAPLGGKPVLAIDPGFRTGCKVVVIDRLGELRDSTVIYPHPPRLQADEAASTVARLADKHRVAAIAVGNGTAGRETEALVRELARAGRLPQGCHVVSVDESGASVYSASEIARREMPDQDVTVRGAVSIGRRLQDPLAELVKIDPRAIGVGQYQHDLHQPTLKKKLDEVVGSCVNRVGVEVNTASAQLLSYVSGIGETIANNIVAYRAEHGPFRSRRQLLKVSRLGNKAFEQAAGFLRIRKAANPLDTSAVHPESYDVVKRMAADLGTSLVDLVGNPDLARNIDPARYIDDQRGEPTIRDILAELDKPGRDPREAFAEVGFREDVTEMAHLQEGMVLNGVVTNVTDFGAFVDVGVHQDGLVHISQLANRFVERPSDVVKVGDRVRVKVMRVELDRRRIGLSMKQV